MPMVWPVNREGTFFKMVKVQWHEAHLNHCLVPCESLKCVLFCQVSERESISR